MMGSWVEETGGLDNLRPCAVGDEVHVLHAGTGRPWRRGVVAAVVPGTREMLYRVRYDDDDLSRVLFSGRVVARHPYRCTICGAGFDPRCEHPAPTADEGRFLTETCTGCLLCVRCDRTGRAAGKALADTERYPDPEEDR